MDHFDVENLPVKCYPSCNQIETIRDNILKGKDPIMLPRNETQEMLDGIKQENNERLDELVQQEDEDYSVSNKNVQAVYHLTEKIQSEIDFTMFPPETRKFSEKVAIKNRLGRFFDYNIQMYCNNLITNIESLILVDHFPPSKFHGYQNIQTMLENSSGYEKMNHLQSLLNMCRQIVPVDVAMQYVNVVEPAISKSSNIGDA